MYLFNLKELEVNENTCIPNLVAHFENKTVRTK